MKADSGASVYLLAAHRKTVAVVAFSHDGDHLGSIGYDHRLVTWDVKKGQQLAARDVTTGLYPSLAFTLNRSMVVTFGGSRRVFDASGKLIHQSDPK
jgi:WD40 repeat protein